MNVSFSTKLVAPECPMRKTLLILAILGVGQLVEKPGSAESAAPRATNLVEKLSSTVDPLRCIAFSAYVTGYDARTGPHPPPSLIDTLLDTVIAQTGFR